MADFVMDDYFANFSTFLLENFGDELISGDINLLLNKLYDSNRYGNFYDVFPQVFANGYFDKSSVMPPALLDPFILYYFKQIGYDIKFKDIGYTGYTNTGTCVLGGFSLYGIDIKHNLEFVITANNLEGITEVHIHSLDIDGVEVPSSVNDLLVANTNIKYINFNGNNLSYIYLAENALLEEVIIPEGLTKLTTYAFYNCKSLKKLVLPKSLSSINSEVFFGTNIEQIEYLGSKQD